MTLRIGGARLEFASPEDFAFALAGRVGLPESRVTEFLEKSDDELRREAETVQGVEQLFNGVLEEDAGIDSFLKEIDLGLVCEDYGWREIIDALNAANDVQETYRKIALVKYVQYLAARRQAIASIHASLRGARTDRPDTPARDPLRETMILGLSAHSAEAAGEEFARLPKGEPVQISLSDGESVPVLLAQRRCRIQRTGEQLEFADDREAVTALRRGRNIVGRALECDVVMNVAYRDVSRRHLVIDADGECVVRLTDISSHGTSLIPEHLANHGV